MLKTIEPERPDPDELLQKIKRESNGKLTVFLGAAAGVGKTFAMLEDAHERLLENVNLLVGLVETHGRLETEKLLAGLPLLPTKLIEYRGRMLREMDIDAILQRRPELVLVDELAHTNVSGSRNTRRFQDVEELLAAGIDVYTTLNIQHIESLNDVVAQVTGVTVRETVPDKIVEEADSVRLIDITPEDLLRRLKEGKVYVAEQAERAIKNFFRIGNINALRELALRFTAKQVDQEMAEYMRNHKINGPWPTAGRVMVCVSPSPFSAQLIRAARQLANGLHAEFLAVHVESANLRFPVGEKERDRILSNLRLAEELGGKTIISESGDVVQELLHIARKNNVTAIVVGKPAHRRMWEFWRGSMVDEIIRDSLGIHVYVIQCKDKNEKITRPPKKWPDKGVLSGKKIFGSLAMVVAITAISWLTKQDMELVNIALLYVIPVVLSAVWWGRWPSYFTACVSIITFDFSFVPPVLEFSVNDARYLWSFVTFLAVSFLIGGQTEKLRQNVRTARKRGESIRELYEFSRHIAAVTESEKIAQELAVYTGESIGCSTVVLTKSENNSLMVKGNYVSGKDTVVEHFSDADRAVAVWAYEQKK